MQFLAQHIYYPWEFDINPELPALAEHHRLWLRSTGLASSELAYQRIKAAQIVEFTAWCWPTGSFDTLAWMLKWLTCHFILDDWLDGDMGQNSQTADVSYYILEQLMADLNNPDWQPSSQLPIMEPAMYEVWQQMRKLPPVIFNPIVRELENWADGCRWESRVRQKDRIPSQKEYLKWRCWSSGSHLCFLFSDITYGLLDESGVVWARMTQHPVMLRLTELVDYMLTVVNDFFSSEKEHSNINLVCILENQAFSGQALQEWLLIQHNAALAEFLEIKTHLNEFFLEPSELAWAETKVQSWCQLLRGSYEWTRQNRRYASNKTDSSPALSSKDERSGCAGELVA